MHNYNHHRSKLLCLKNTKRLIKQQKSTTILTFGSPSFFQQKHTINAQPEFSPKFHNYCTCSKIQLSSSSDISSPTPKPNARLNNNSNTTTTGKHCDEIIGGDFITILSEQINNNQELGFIKASFSEPCLKSAVGSLNSSSSNELFKELNLGEGLKILNKFSVRPIIMDSSNPANNNHGKNNKDKSTSSFKSPCYQFSLFLKDGKAIHRNFTKMEQVLRIVEELVMHCSFQQVLIQKTSGEDIHMTLKYEKDTLKLKHLKMNKILPVTSTKSGLKSPGGDSVNENTSIQLFSHNRKKDYILEEGKLINFLIELGIQHETSGKIFSQKYNKFKQMNHFLEIFKESISSLLNQTGNLENQSLRIVDFGSGKSYLTFAIHYYLKEVLKIGNIQIIGLDLKKDVIEHCNSISKKYSYEKELKFIVGDIHSFDAASHFTSYVESPTPNNNNGSNYNIDDFQNAHVDIVVSLHACNTATDKALEQAIRWKSKCILAVPCCQHEIYQQMKHLKALPSNHFMEPLLQHNIFNEKFCSIYTDSLRCQLLEIMGYKTNVIEFIDMEHTPKNVMIRANRAAHDIHPERKAQLISKYQTMLNNLPVKITLEHLLFPQGLPSEK